MPLKRPYHHDRNEQGQVLVLVLVFMPVIFVAIAFAVTLSFVRSRQVVLAQMTSYAVKAAVQQTVSVNGTVTINTSQAQGVADSVFNENLTGSGLPPTTTIEVICVNGTQEAPQSVNGVSYDTPTCVATAKADIVSVPFQGIVAGLIGHGPFNLQTTQIASPLQYAQNTVA